MSGIGNLLDLISDISELFDEHSNFPTQRHTTVSHKKSSVIDSKKEKQKNKYSDDSAMTSEKLKNEESVLGNPPDHSSHIQEKTKDKITRPDMNKSRNLSGSYNLNYKNLKNAIVLSEILSPPLALRSRRFR